MMLNLARGAASALRLGSASATTFARQNIAQNVQTGWSRFGLAQKCGTLTSLSCHMGRPLTHPLAPTKNRSTSAAGSSFGILSLAQQYPFAFQVRNSLTVTAVLLSIHQPMYRWHIGSGLVTRSLYDHTVCRIFCIS